MNIRFTKSILLFIAILPLVIIAENRIPCRYGSQDCFPYGCIPEDTTLNRDIVIAKQRKGDTTIKTYCGTCFEDADCGGSQCKNGLCAKYIAPTPPRPIRPTFHLLTAELSFANDTNSMSGYFSRPIVGVGYLYESAFRTSAPLQRKDGSFVFIDIPHYYWHAGASAAFNAGSQNVFAEAGLTYYYPVIFISSYSLLGIYQRSGSALWKSTSVNRFGPALSVGFAQNVYVKAGYLFSADHNGKSAPYLSIIYMKDLLGDLLPDSYKKNVPKNVQ